MKLTLKELMGHIHIIGKSGMGKSVLLYYMILRVILMSATRGWGACVLDPHGSLHTDLVLEISTRHPYLADRIILFDPANNPDVVLGFNPIPKDAKQRADYVSSMLVGAMLKAWGQDDVTLTPRISRWLNNWIQVAIDNDLTLVDLLPLLSTTNRYKAERQRLASLVQNPAVVEDLEMFERSNNLQRQSLVEGPANRLLAFLRSFAIRNALGQQQQTLDLASIMAEGKILLVNLNGGSTVSTDNMKLMGTMLVNECFRVAKLRNPHAPNLKPFFLYIDEFANFVTRDVARALEELRKFKMFLTLAHQHMAQLREEDEYLANSVLTNIHTRIVFGGLSAEDSELMRDEIATVYVDLHRVKDEMYQTKVRHVEQTRTTRGHTTGESTGQSEGLSQTQSMGRTEGESRSHSQGRSETDTRSESQSKTVGHSDGVTVTEGQSTSKGRVMGRTAGEAVTTASSVGSSTTTGQSYNRSETKTTGGSQSWHHGVSGSRSHQEGWSSSESSGASETSGTSAGQTDSRTDQVRSGQPTMDRTGSQGHTEQTGNSHSHADSHSNAEGRSGSRTQSEGWNDGRSRGTSFSDGVTDGTTESTSDSESASVSNSRSRSIGVSESTSRSEGRSHSTAKSQTDSVSRSETTGHSHAAGRSQTDTTGASHSTSRSESTARTKTETASTSQGRSETTVPFLSPVEYQELSSRTYYSLTEMQYLVMAAIKNQGVGQAFIKTKTGEPKQTSIRRVTMPSFHPTLSPQRMEAFRQRVIAAHPELYLTTEEARRQQRERQIRVFGQPLLFDSREVIVLKSHHTAGNGDDSDDGGSPFA